MQYSEEISQSQKLTESTAYKSKIGWFVRKPRTTLLLIVMIAFLGVMSLIQLPKEEAPEIDFGIIIVNTMYTGASANDIDSLITQEVEKKVKNIVGISKLSSSSKNSISSVVIEFEPGYDTTKALADVRSKVDEVKPNLPADAEDPVIKEVTSSDKTVFNIVLTGGDSPLRLRDEGEKFKNYLEKHSKVNEVTISGGYEREIKILVNPISLRDYEVTLSQLTSIIGRHNIDFPIGSIDIDKLEYNVRYQGKFKTVDDIKNIPIKNIGNSVVFLSDIAEVIEDGNDPDSISKFYTNGLKESKDAVIIGVFTKKRAGIFESDRLIRESADAYIKENLPSYMTATYTQESIVNTTESYRNVFSSGIQTIIIVFLTILFFLGLKEALITASIIPLTFLMAFTVLKFMDSTLNFLSNFAMILAIGILVDTAIVIVEGIYSYTEKGYDGKTAAELALDEFIAPLTAGTLTTLAVFIPLISLPGVMGKYLSYIPVTVTILLIASLVLSVTANPTLASLLMKPRIQTHKIDNMVRRLIKEFLHKLETVYEKLLRVFINTTTKRLGLFIIIVIVFFLSFLIPTKFAMFPLDDSNMMSISIKKPIGTVKEVTLDEIKQIENILIKQPEIETYNIVITQNNAEFTIDLWDKDIRKEKGERTSIELSDYLNAELLKIKNMDIVLQSAQKGPPSAAPVGFRVISSDPSYIKQAQLVIADIKKMLKNVKGTTGVDDDIENSPGDFSLLIDKKLAALEGVDPMEIPMLIRTALEGSTIATIDRDNTEIDVKIGFENTGLELVKNIKNLEVVNNQGRKVSIGRLVEVEINPGLNIVKRNEGDISFTVTSQVKTDFTPQEINIEMEKLLDTYEIPEGISIENAGENEENQDLLIAMLKAFIVAVLVIFLLLVIQFNSYTQPLLIIMTIIFAQIGVNIGLYLTNTERSMAFIIGVISLGGIVVNDAIIMVDQINKNTNSDDKEDILLDKISSAASSRLQPIILTTLTTTAGIFPLVFIDKFWSGLGYTIIFGLSVASFMTLFVTPGMYYQFEKDLKRTVYCVLTIFIIIGILGFTLIKLT